MLDKTTVLEKIVNEDNVVVVEIVANGASNVNVATIEVKENVGIKMVFAVTESVVSRTNIVDATRTVEKDFITVVENEQKVAVDKIEEDTQTIVGMTELAEVVSIEISVQHRNVEMLKNLLRNIKASVRWVQSLA